MKFKIVIGIITALVLIVVAVITESGSQQPATQANQPSQSQDAFRNFKIPN